MNPFEVTYDSGSDHSRNSPREEDDLLTQEEEKVATKATVEETKRNTVYSWLNTNPIYVLKCEYWFLDAEGQDIPLDNDTGCTIAEHQQELPEADRFKITRRRQHPLACGEDPMEVRFFEVGKQYLFLRPERQHLVYEGGYKDRLEFETWFERILECIGNLTKTCGAMPTHVSNLKKGHLLENFETIVDDVFRHHESQDFRLHHESPDVQAFRRERELSSIRCSIRENELAEAVREQSSPLLWEQGEADDGMLTEGL
jgi:hypothetical protein